MHGSDGSCFRHHHLQQPSSLYSFQMLSKGEAKGQTQVYTYFEREEVPHEDEEKRVGINNKYLLQEGSYN